MVFVGEFKKNVTRQTWRTLFHFGEYLFQSTRHFGECLKKMVSHTVDIQHQTISGSIPADNITNDLQVELDCSNTGAGGNPCCIMLLHNIVLY